MSFKFPGSTESQMHCSLFWENLLVFLSSTLLLSVKLQAGTWDGWFLLKEEQALRMTVFQRKHEVFGDDMLEAAFSQQCQEHLLALGKQAVIPEQDRGCHS